MPFDEIRLLPAGDPAHRRLVWLRGPAETARARAAAWCRQLAHPQRAAWVGTAPPAHLPVSVCPPPQADTLLGRSLDALVFDAAEGIAPDALGAAAGALCGGGVLLLILPVAGLPSPFGRRMRSILEAALEAAPGDAPLPLPGTPPGAIQPDRDGCLTPDQRRAVAALERLSRGRGGRPLVLTADRGRGKSAALGIAAGRLLARGRLGGSPPLRMVLTAPRLTAVAPVLERARAALPPGQGRRETAPLTGPGGHMEYLPPDAACGAAADLVLVDEAGGIPVQWLQRLLDAHGRIAFTTTLHGYEGTGQGFAARFCPLLYRRFPGTRFLHLERPVRWAAGDPLEALLEHLLLLGARPREVPPAAEGRVERLSPQRLAGDEALLEAVYGLLALAHYRTRPSDLQRLLEDAAMETSVLWSGGAVAAVALVAREGGLDPDLCRQVWAGRRRPRGHLLPVGLILHGGLAPDAGRLRYHRVVRIAVHPGLQGRGLGGRLLAAVVQRAGDAGADAVGASFGASAELLAFWRGQGFAPVRVGVKPEVSSGGWGVTVLRPLTPAGEGLATAARQRFARALGPLLADPLAGMEPALAAGLWRGAAVAPPDPDQARALAGFAHDQRVFEACLPELAVAVPWGLSDPARAAALDACQRDALVMRVLQHRDWDVVARHAGVHGRRGVIRLLRGALARWLPPPG
ncbi:GNAT family N-acetyltransferase [Ectothiorhodospira mobilis]|uniref:GNAT family N-acetyltransferase n=1 Tax=Ectothiorhodospira mobilis TaxID=195064 RepID=UPI001EE9A709|nr:GNAT family N-acetyltransferase [Ectothiorhodospira mobilis]MCG5536659.1 GNAT family N-acetyltransferase [Ectothiorhodospira mobilis]